MSRRRFGQVNKMMLNWYDYNIGLMGQSGVGKTTIAYEICNKYLGQDEYILLNIGREDGVRGLANVVSEDVREFDKLQEIVDDIMDYPEDYKDLKMIVLDTMDELVRIAEEYTVRMHNIATPEKRAETVNQAFGGYGRGEAKAIDFIQKEIDRLNSVGIRVFEVFHTKNRTKVDVITDAEYDELSSKMTNRAFEEFKTKLQVLGVAYVDREVVVENKKIRGQKKSVGRVESEERVIIFRDDSFAVDCKSRFADIKPRIPFDADAFVSALNEAIESNYQNAEVGDNIEEDRKEQEKAIEKQVEQVRQEKKEESFKDDAPDIIREKIKIANEGSKSKFIEFVKENSIDVKDLGKASAEQLKTMIEILS